LLDHKADFKLLVLDRYGHDAADSIAWAGTRLLCIAQDFTRYDEHAIAQIDRNIELIRYRRYEDDMLLLDLVNVVTSSVPAAADEISKTSNRRQPTDTPIIEIVAKLSGSLLDVWESVRAFAMSLGDDVQVKELKLYWAYKRIKNFMSAEVRPTKGSVVLYLKVDPDTVTLEPGFTRDVRNIGHWGLATSRSRCAPWTTSNMPSR
jgi:predicted transport protein